MGPVLLALAFALELAVLTACAAVAYGWPEPLALRLLAGAAAVSAMAALWGRWVAPRAARALTGPASVLFRTAWFGVGALAVGTALGAAPGVGFTAVCLADALGLRLLPRPGPASEVWGGDG